MKLEPSQKLLIVFFHIQSWACLFFLIGGLGSGCIWSWFNLQSFKWESASRLEGCTVDTASKDTNTKNTLKCKTCCGSNHCFSLASSFPLLPEHREGLPCRKMGPFVLFKKQKTEAAHLTSPCFPLPALPLPQRPRRLHVQDGGATRQQNLHKSGSSGDRKKEEHPLPSAHQSPTPSRGCTYNTMHSTTQKLL